MSLVPHRPSLVLRRGGRIAALTGFMIAAGAALGALGGVVVWLVLTLRASGVAQLGDALLHADGAALVGALVGATAAPALGWGLLGDVPLWRALAEPAAGATVGAGVLVLLSPSFGMLLGGGALGALLTTIGLLARARRAAARRDVAAVRHR